MWVVLLFLVVLPADLKLCLANGLSVAGQRHLQLLVRPGQCVHHFAKATYDYFLIVLVAGLNLRCCIRPGEPHRAGASAAAG